MRARLMMMMLCMYMALINPLGYDLHDKRKGVGIPQSVYYYCKVASFGFFFRLESCLAPGRNKCSRERLKNQARTHTIHNGVRIWDSRGDEKNHQEFRSRCGIRNRVVHRKCHERESNYWVLIMGKVSSAKSAGDGIIIADHQVYNHKCITQSAAESSF